MKKLLLALTDIGFVLFFVISIAVILGLGVMSGWLIWYTYGSWFMIPAIFIFMCYLLLILGIFLFDDEPNPPKTRTVILPSKFLLKRYRTK